MSFSISLESPPSSDFTAILSPFAIRARTGRLIVGSNPSPSFIPFAQTVRCPPITNLPLIGSERRGDAGTEARNHAVAHRFVARCRHPSPHAESSYSGDSAPRASPMIAFHVTGNSFALRISRIRVRRSSMSGLQKSGFARTARSLQT
ncbi:MAG: hypothetical protein BWY06_03034 [Candidatus Latescibacteria bacterium ADurb.Bin168]|nr:MAG: hypothetical protein BWY06_03034 [Candidatus Latescibacteria bacterium ADurb.Bin168]